MDLLDFNLGFYCFNGRNPPIGLLLESYAQSTLHSLKMWTFCGGICSSPVSRFSYSSLNLCVIFSDSHENIAYRPVRLMVAKEGKHLELPGTKDKPIIESSLRYFTYRKLTYLWHPVDCKFINIEDLESNVRVILCLLK